MIVSLMDYKKKKSKKRVIKSGARSKKMKGAVGASSSKDHFIYPYYVNPRDRFASAGMLVRFRSELKSDFASLLLQVKAGFKEVDARFNRLEERFDTLEARFNSLEARFDTLEARFDTLEARFDSLEARFDAKIEAMEARFDAKIEAMEARFNAQFEAQNAKIDRALALFEEQRHENRMMLDQLIMINERMCKVERKTEHSEEAF